MICAISCEQKVLNRNSFMSHILLNQKKISKEIISFHYEFKTSICHLTSNPIIINLLYR